MKKEVNRETPDKTLAVNTSIRDLLILIAYQVNAPTRSIAKAAGMRHDKLYKIIPKGKNRAHKKTQIHQGDKNGGI